MVEYKVEVLDSTVLTLDTIYIRLIGSVCNSKPQVLHSPLSSERTVTVCSDNNVGTVLLVELEARSGFLHFLKDWFCAKLVVTTPEGDEVVFPCYQWLDSKKPIVSLRNSKASLVQNETEITLRYQRQQELEERQQNFRWKKNSDLPSSIDADSASNLPNEVRFSFTKDMEMMFTAVKVLAELELESLIGCSESWRSFNQLQSILRHPKPNKAGAYVQQHWQEDEFFGYQTLNGLNPMLIERCTKLPSNFPVTEDMVRSSLEGSSLETEMTKGNIFLCDYKRLKGFKGNKIDGKQQYLAAPLCLLYSTPEKTLKPIAIQLLQKPDKNNPIFLPTDSQWDWLLAKIFVRNAEFHEHELNFHLLRTHLLAEVFTIATLRNLPSAHPLYKLLKPHTLYTLQINIMARHLLISPGGIFDKFTSIGQKDAVKTYLPNVFSTLTYSSLCLPENIKERGLEDIPNYFYRDEAQKLWDIIKKYADGVVKCYYLSAEDVKKDSELQNWISEIFNFGFLGREQSGIPKSFSTVDELIKFVTMVIFTVSAQHAAVNNGQFDFGGWMPNLPTALRLPPQCKKGVTTEETIFQTLPDVTITIHAIAVLYLLSKKSSDHYQLGNFREELFSEAVPCGHIEEFQKALKILQDEDENKNQSLEPGYLYLNPTTVDNSVAL
ncbi:polyunsaturated fatty acid lipoxygenase ALOX15B-like [Astyanax mexicanus]|uniref:polyunsaturated fatty acid lipoxygenase ALOX15B-like n=1 Tax=Astyanax mexicanus TaxID=7994 RepID=UPI0020CABE33|nr:polyunsaturated fatty acid lipoxygenase ALOX15B-like [Astyanax mexicanus]